MPLDETTSETSSMSPSATSGVAEGQFQQHWIYHPYPHKNLSQGNHDATVEISA